MNYQQLVPFAIKFCGLRRAVDVEAAIDAGADAIGLNFYPPSPRCVTPKIAKGLIDAIRGRAQIVGVFVNPTIEELFQVLEVCPLDFIQLHGDESPSMVLNLALPPIIKGLPWRQANTADAEMARRWSESSGETNLAGFLIDAYDADQRGGTGRETRWDLLNPRPQEFEKHFLVLAGGLKPENIARAIQIGQPDGVDTASGIESSPGVKDIKKMRAFVEQAKKGFESVE